MGEALSASHLYFYHPRTYSEGGFVLYCAHMSSDISVAKNTFSLTMGLVGQKILAFVYFTILARLLGPGEIGKYTFALAFTTIFSVLTDLGLTPALVREVARGEEGQKRILEVLLPIKALLAAVAFLCAMGGAVMLGYPRETLILIAASGGVMILDSFHLILYGFLRGKKILSYEAIGMIAGQAISVLLGVAAAVLHFPIVFFIAALGVGSVFNVAWAARALARQGIRPSFLWNPQTSGRIFSIALPFALAGIFAKVYSYIDTVLLASFKDHYVVGIYSVPYKITYAFQFLPMALSAALFPALSSEYKKNPLLFRDLFVKGLNLMSVMVMPIVGGIIALAPEILIDVFGSAYAPSLVPLRISILGLLFIFLYYPAGALLNASDRQGLTTAFLGVSMTVNIVLNLFLIPGYGASGASIAAVFTNALLFVMTFAAAIKVIQWPKGFFSHTAKTLLAAFLMALVVGELKTFLPWLFTIPLGMAFYGALAFLLRIVSTDDIRNFRDLFKKNKGASSVPLEP